MANSMTSASTHFATVRAVMLSIYSTGYGQRKKPHTQISLTDKSHKRAGILSREV